MSDHGPHDIRDKQERLRSLYSGDTFGLVAKDWATTLAEHFRSLERRTSSVLNWEEPQTSIRDAGAFLDGAFFETPNIDQWLRGFRELLETTLSRGQNLHHPRYLGHQVPASIPIAALFDAIGSVTNQVMAIYEMGPWATAVEHAMVERLGCYLEYPDQSFAGVVTNGGSLANLTALLTARNVSNEGVWRKGMGDARQVAIVVQQDAHYCITRAAGILGIGTEQIISVPVDAARKMRVDLLDKTLSSLRAEGRLVIAVVACACATPIGAFDPLDEVADVCQQHGVWMHVDAAHGGAVVMSDRYRHLVNGINRADSVVWDAHKMLFVPALCAFTFYKDKRHRYAAFQQKAPYLFDPSNPGIADYDSGAYTFECTKRAATYSLWGIWSLFGPQLFSDLVDVSFALTRLLHEKLDAAADFEPLHVPQCNIQAFRFVPEFVRGWTAEELGEFQLAVRRRVITSGSAYIVPVELDGVGALRCTLINPCTTEADLDAVLQAIRDCANENAS